MDQGKVDEICRLFKGCRYPMQQVKIVADLVGVTKHQALRVLIAEGFLPKGTTLSNGRPGMEVQYRDPGTLPPEIKKFIEGSTMDAKRVSLATGISVEEVFRLRREEQGRIQKEREKRKHAGRIGQST